MANTVYCQPLPVRGRAEGRGRPDLVIPHPWAYSPEATCPPRSRILTRASQFQRGHQLSLVSLFRSVQLKCSKYWGFLLRCQISFSPFHLKALMVTFFRRKETWCCGFESILCHLLNTLSINVFMYKIGHKPEFETYEWKARKHTKLRGQSLVGACIVSDSL